ncbi:Plug domain-containing protein [Chryseobacterium ginsengisoli]|uniref:Plug domain-containing protein n=1 Tax=Chryseobacterium ginsengisoli TaxID=363853 RepID=A0ABP9MXN2_9FLAO
MSKKIISFLFILIVLGNFQAQGKAEKALEVFSEKYPQEKIHLVFNKNSFIAGENIWFKSFVFDGYDLSNISTTLFVELYDSNKTQISKKILPLVNGQGSGNFTLPENLKEGVYYVRAYTTWMANFNEDFQTLRPIVVYNPSSPQKLVINDNSKWTASIFPESGTFIDGIDTKFAVRLQSKGITPTDWSGYVVDAEKPDVKITSFKGFDQNVGSFSLTPKAGKKYKLIVEDSKSNKQTIDLPTVSDSGVNLQVSTGNEAVKFYLKSKNIAPGTLYKVIGTISNQLVFKVNSEKILEQSYSIPAAQLINGILQLTVFDDKENIVAQRLCFIQPELLKIKKPTLQSLALNESPRTLNTFNISQNSDNEAYTAFVMDGNSESSEDENSLLSTLWLTGDITSKIYTPAQYFTQNHNSEALDALLITEKWKRFDWKTIMSGTFPIISYKPQPYISYKGKVTVQGKPAANTDMNLLFEKPDQGTKLYQIKTDANGFFSLKGLYFEDAIKFSYQLNDAKIPKEQVQVIFQPDYSFIPLKNNLPASNYDLVQRANEDKPTNQVERYIVTKNNQSSVNEKATLIEEVNLKGQKKDKTQELNEKLSGPLFQSANETVFDLVNDNNSAQGSINILQWLQGRVAGLTLESDMGNYIPKLRGSEMNIYLDEIKIDPSMVSSISTADIAMVKVIKDNFAGGFGGGKGTIAIYTKRGGITGSVSNSTVPTKLKQITLNGFDKETPFVSPVYGDDNFNNISKDFRSTLYWNPRLKTQPKEPTKIQFYNNDDAKSYKVIIMGFDEKDYAPIYYNETIK